MAWRAGAHETQEEDEAMAMTVIRVLLDSEETAWTFVKPCALG
jgi:hypothetical protein